ncbi:hypothetical protein [Nitrosomonas sp. Nm58]|nr:hypothetical protein [Nitrosomonas sp. Nm58]SDY50816.1 hypothetical protein SAMN05421754_101168 [Nitrosomonas sp. Nm58]
MTQNYKPAYPVEFRKRWTLTLLISKLPVRQRTSSRSVLAG